MGPLRILHISPTRDRAPRDPCPGEAAPDGGTPTGPGLNTRPGPCSSSHPPLPPAAQPGLWWAGVGAGGLLGPGQPGREARGLERQPVPPAGPGGAHAGARKQGSSRETRMVPEARALSATGSRSRKTAPPLPTNPPPRPAVPLQSETTGGGTQDAPMTCPSRSWLAPGDARPPEGGLALLRSGTGQSCLGPWPYHAANPWAGAPSLECSPEPGLAPPRSEASWSQRGGLAGSREKADAPRPHPHSGPSAGPAAFCL